MSTANSNTNTHSKLRKPPPSPTSPTSSPTDSKNPVKTKPRSKNPLAQIQWLFRSNIPHKRASYISLDPQGRNFFGMGMGDILGVVVHPSETLRSLTESRKLLAETQHRLEVAESHSHSCPCSPPNLHSHAHSCSCHGSPSPSYPCAHSHERSHSYPPTHSRAPTHSHAHARAPERPSRNPTSATFFPRKRETRALQKVLDGEPAWTVVFGASGVGKTSIIRALLSNPTPNSNSNSNQNHNPHQTKYHTLHFDLRIAAFSDLGSLYTSLSVQMERFFEGVGCACAWGWGGCCACVSGAGAGGEGGCCEGDKERGKGRGRGKGKGKGKGGYEVFESEAWVFKHDRLSVERRILEHTTSTTSNSTSANNHSGANANNGNGNGNGNPHLKAGVTTSDVARLMELFRSALVRYWAFQPDSDFDTDSDSDSDSDFDTDFDDEGQGQGGKAPKQGQGRGRNNNNNHSRSGTGTGTASNPHANANTNRRQASASASGDSNRTHVNVNADMDRNSVNSGNEDNEKGKAKTKTKSRWGFMHWGARKSSKNDGYRDGNVNEKGKGREREKVNERGKEEGRGKANAKEEGRGRGRGRARGRGKFVKRMPVIFFDEAHKLPALIQSPETLKCLLDSMLVLTKQDRLCHVIHATSDPFYQAWLRQFNVMQHCKIITIGDCSKAETRRFFHERVIPRVPERMRAGLVFEVLFDAFGGKLAHWDDYITDYVNSNGTLDIKQSSHFLQAHALLNLHIIHSSQASRSGGGPPTEAGDASSSAARGAGGAASVGANASTIDTLHPALGPAGFKIYSPLTHHGMGAGAASMMNGPFFLGGDLAAFGAGYGLSASAYPFALGGGFGFGGGYGYGGGLGGLGGLGAGVGIGGGGLAPEFTAMELLKVMSRLARADTQYLPYFHLCRELGVRAVDGMVRARVLDLRWTETVTREGTAATGAGVGAGVGVGIHAGVGVGVGVGVGMTPAQAVRDSALGSQHTAGGRAVAGSSSGTPVPLDLLGPPPPIDDIEPAEHGEEHAGVGVGVDVEEDAVQGEDHGEQVEEDEEEEEEEEEDMMQHDVFEEVMEVVGPKLLPLTPIMRYAMRDVVREYEDDQSVSEYASLSDGDFEEY
uniref:AAA+ ATPase domain-containing protein n=1 Tax=Psilocybe cubensis TaxID=181762 RepID=A0A8H7XTK5_PSICU